MSAILRDLEALDTLFSHPSTWTQEVYARDAKGRPASSLRPTEACSWCFMGALMKVGASSDTIAFLSILIPMGISAWNDAPGRTFADIKNLIKQAKEKINA